MSNEPMSIVADDSSPPPRAGLGGLSAIPASIAVISAVLIFVWSTNLAAAAQLALLVPTDCGTGRHTAQYELYHFVPYFLTFPIAGLIDAHLTGVGVFLSCCSVWASTLGWGPSALFVIFR